MSYVQLKNNLFDITTENFIFTITSEKVKSNYPTLPIKDLKVLLLRDNSIFDGKWHFPLSNFSSDAFSALDFLNVEEDTYHKHLGFIQNNLLSEENSISSIHVSLLNEDSLNHISLNSDAEFSLFSLKEIHSLDIPTHQKELLFGKENANSFSDINILEFLQKEVLTSTIAKYFLPSEFTIAELLLIIQAINPDFSVPKPNFVTRLTDCKARSGLLIEILDDDGSPKKTNKYSQKPAQLYHFNPSYKPKRLSIYNNFN